MGAGIDHPWNAAAASALDWWRDAGVDMLVDDAPRDWTHAAPSPAQAIAPVAVASEAAPGSALPDTLEAFAAWRTSDGAPDHALGPLVAPRIVSGATTVIVVDHAEDVDGRPALFAPQTERLLDAMLAAIGLDSGSVTILPLCAAAPASGRVPPELENALGNLLRHALDLAAPARLILIGPAAKRAVEPASRDGAAPNSYLVNYRGGESLAIATYHPRFLLAKPAAKAEAWRHLQTLIDKGESGA